ncbi:TPR-like protein [Lophium mytilinum]|uniref:TPR-like protein n=1 Tax=Lophium mytilinum TaxID=390894 RepID=A0A6A6QE13_9PEZI|nr:TPR-like protein [Lophium mytilinum]
MNPWTPNPPILGGLDPIPGPLVSQQTYGRYGSLIVPHNMASQMLPTTGYATTGQRSVPQLIHPSTAFPIHASQSADLVDNTPAMPRTSMAPPANPRKRKAPTLRADDWEPYKARVLELHITLKLPLPEVKKRIEYEFGFNAELRQYRTRISQWKKDKNVKTKEMEAIVRKRQKRKFIETEKRELIFEVRGSEVEPHKIDRWMKRHDISESSPYVFSPAAPTPSDVGCRTVSERGSPSASPAYSAGTPYLSPPNSTPVARHPPFPSPTVSTSRMVRPQGIIFAGQSPAASHRTISERASPLASPAYSAVIPYFSPAGSTPVAHTPPILSPTLSISSIVQPQDSTFAGQSPAIAYRSLPGFRPGSTPLPVSQGQLTSADPQLHGNSQPREAVQERYQQMEEEQLREELSLAETMYGARDSMTLGILFKLGNVLLQQGRYKSAEDVILRLIEGRRVQDGDDGGGTLSAFSLLAEVLSKQGMYARAEKLHRRTLKSRKAILGDEHRDTLVSMSQLATVLQKQGRLQEAEELDSKVLEMRLRVLGPEHPETLISMTNLALTYKEQGRLQKAEELDKKALEIRTRVLGLEHRETLTGIGNLGLTYYRQGRLQEAEELEEKVLESKTRVLGAEHPETLISMGNLGSTYSKQGRLQEAEELEEKVLEIRTRVLGAEHRETLISMNNLACTWKSQSRDKDAVSLMKKCLELREKHLGPQHLDTQISLLWLKKWQVDDLELGRYLNLRYLSRIQS